MTTDTSGLGGLELHHLGIACRDLDREEEALAVLGYQREGEDFEDREQGVAGRFVTGPGPRLELLVDLPGRSVVSPWLHRGSRIYHYGFTTSDISTSCRQLRERGARLVSDLRPAPAFGGRRICFWSLRNLQLVELVEAP